MKKVEVFIDGFNLYHGILDCNETSTYRKVLWLDIMRFIKSYVIKPNETLNSIYYFTALPKKNTGRLERHNTYCSVLMNSGIKVIYGNYKTKNIRCKICNQEFSTFEEKETDVNIALAILKRAVEDGYDKAILFSGDSDLAPAIENTKELYPQKEFQILFPINRNKSKRLKQVSPLAPIYQYLPCYKKCQFPDFVDLKTGEKIKKPLEWS